MNHLLSPWKEYSFSHCFITFKCCWWRSYNYLLYNLFLLQILRWLSLLRNCRGILSNKRWRITIIFYLFSILLHRTTLLWRNICSFCIIIFYNRFLINFHLKYFKSDLILWNLLLDFFFSWNFFIIDWYVGALRLLNFG